MNDVSVVRLYALRAVYLLMAVGLSLVMWPGIIHPEPDLSLKSGLVRCLLGALVPLAIIGLFHPLRMLPLLLFETLWKVIWLGFIAWPAWSNHTMSANMQSTVYDCALVVIVIAGIPWPYVVKTYLLSPSERWR